jgi:hypothetical protein
MRPCLPAHTGETYPLFPWASSGPQHHLSLHHACLLYFTCCRQCKAFVLLFYTCRTFDPEEADFFFMPAYLTCYIWPINAWTDGPW